MGLAEQKAFGEAGLALAGRLFRAWDDYRHDGNRARLIEQVAPLKRELRTLLERSARKSTKTGFWAALERLVWRARARTSYGGCLARPPKPLIEHIRYGTFPPHRHGHLLAGDAYIPGRFRTYRER